MTRLPLALALFVAALAGSVALAPAGARQPDPRGKQKEAPRAPKLPAGTAEHRDLRYGPHQERNTLDLFVPKAEKPLPLVIWVHGGGWQNGSKNGGNPALPLLGRGYAVASINYRLSQHDVFPAQIEDCKAAVRFLRANARKYNLNPDAFGAWGASAGGHLVALLGTSGDVQELEGTVGDHPKVSSRVQAVCDFFGPTDFVKLSPPATDNNAVARLFGGSTGTKKELAGKASPLTYVTKDDPPFLIVQGDMDKLVPLQQSELLQAALTKRGVTSELVVIKGGGHGGAGFATPENQEKIATFFDRNLKK